MKTLFLEAGMGAAGDMLTAALLELFDDRSSIVEELNGLGIAGVTYSLEPSVKCGITGSHMTVKVHGEEEESIDSHCHDHDHGHHHEHHGLGDIRAMINALPVSGKVKADAIAVYGIIADAESHVHGRPVEEVHFHEVGAMDAVADVVAVCFLMDRLSPEKVIVSPVNTGHGHCHTQHGVLPVPAPATAEILKGLPCYDGGVEGELCTPTGAALLKYFASSYGPRPAMSVDKIGYGMGKKDFERANCVRAMLGEVTAEPNDVVSELQANIDDMSAEEIAYAAEKILAAGALDVWTTPVLMKKGRPGVVLTALVREDMENRVVEAFFRHTSTIGLRKTLKERFVLSREESEKDTCVGKVRFKKSCGYGVERTKPEFEDLRRIAEKQDLSLREVKDRLSF